MRTQKQNENLAKLAKYLLALPKDYEQFDMGEYYTGHKYFVVEHGLPPPCGSIACAVGHGPAAGIGCNSTGSWINYCNMELTADTDEFNWLFSEEWVSLDNTATGAALRIVALLTHRWHTTFNEIVNEIETESIEENKNYLEMLYDEILIELDVEILDRPEDWA